MMVTEKYEELGGQPSSAPPDLRAQFGAALPPYVRSRVHPTDLIDRYLKQAVDHGWTIKELAHECSRDLGMVDRIGGIVTSRLAFCSKTPHHSRTSEPVKTWCGQCSAPGFRWEVDADDLPVQRCPRCSTGGN